MKTLFYKIEALTNLHAGSGDANYGVVDNLIQRDVVTELPVIHGSSFKGAIKEHFEGVWENESDKNEKINYIFGDNDNSGNYRFLPALLLAIPLRSNKKPYYIATSPATIKELLRMTEDLGFSLDKEIKDTLEKLSKESITGNPKIFAITTGLAIENFESFDNLKIELNSKTKEFLGVMDDNLILLNESDFKTITNNSNLPVIARNQLVNGESKNLWYEQVVPRKSIFWTAIVIPDSKKYLTDFEKGLKEYVHIGANASVGYGFTKISRVKKDEK